LITILKANPDLLQIVLTRMTLLTGELVEFYHTNVTGRDVDFQCSIYPSSDTIKLAKNAHQSIFQQNISKTGTCRRNCWRASSCGLVRAG